MGLAREGADVAFNFRSDAKGAAKTKKQIEAAGRAPLRSRPISLHARRR